MATKSKAPKLPSVTLASKISAKTESKLSAKTVSVEKGMPMKEGMQAGIRKAMKMHGGDHRGATYNPKTGKCTVM